MSKGLAKKKYSGKFKQQVVETMHREKLSSREAEKRFGITSHTAISTWERIYLEEGPEGLYVERRGRGSKGRPPEVGKAGRRRFDCREPAIESGKRIPKKLASLGFGGRATPAQKARVIEKLRQNLSLTDLLCIAQLP